MIELFFSTDGKHTVHVTAATLEETDRLMPEALRLYGVVVDELGTKPALWEPVMNGKRSGQANGGREPKKGAMPAAPAPVCELHETPMVLRKGRFGRFWSCNRKNELGQWCSVTVDA